MDLGLYDWDVIVLGLLAACLFAECVILFVRVNSMRNKMESEAESIRTEELLKYEKKRNELEMLLKERELEIKAEYEDMLALTKAAKREHEEKSAELEIGIRNARETVSRANLEYERYSKMKDDYRKLTRNYAAKLSEISKLDMDDIRREAEIEMKRSCFEDMSVYRAEMLEKSKREIDDRALEILGESMQRLSVRTPQSYSATVVKIPDESMKGRLIGKEGRNIRTFEAETATTLVIDESPDSVMISSFNPERREIAKAALEYLMRDGRINPTTIESAVKSAKELVRQRACDTGTTVADSLGVAGTNPEILKLVGFLSSHLSLNQNTLEHSVETAKLCSMIAAELGCDASVAKRIGLFHDIGKVVSDADLSHARAGAAVLLKYGESELVANAVESHHGEVRASSIYAVILTIADAISATRPGARMETTEGYIRRVKSLEDAAMSFEGVVSAYVLQAGRELRVIVRPDTVSDITAHDLAKKIRSKIEDSVKHSIPIKVTLIREQRFSETTRVRA